MAASTFRIPHQVYGLGSTISTLTSRLITALDRLVLDYLKSKRLIGATMASMGCMRSDSTELQKALVKIGRIIEREAFKSAPYLKHLLLSSPDHGFIIADRNPVEIRLVGIVATVENTRLKVVMDRYIRYLNYKCRKYGLPLYLPPSGLRAISSETEGDGSSGIRQSRFVMSLRVTPWIPYDSSGNPISQAGMVAMVSALAEEGRDPDSIYGYSNGVDPNPCGVSWRRIGLEVLSSAEEGGAIPDVPSSMLTPELLYMHLPSISNCVVTISRKLSYAYRAFAIGAPAA